MYTAWLCRACDGRLCQTIWKSRDALQCTNAAKLLWLSNSGRRLGAWSKWSVSPLSPGAGNLLFPPPLAPPPPPPPPSYAPTLMIKQYSGQKEWDQDQIRWMGRKVCDGVEQGQWSCEGLRAACRNCDCSLLLSIRSWLAPPYVTGYIVFVLHHDTCLLVPHVASARCTSPVCLVVSSAIKGTLGCTEHTHQAACLVDAILLPAQVDHSHPAHLAAHVAVIHGGQWVYYSLLTGLLPSLPPPPLSR